MSRRISVSLQDDDYEVLRRLSQLNGESMSAIISGLVQTVSPALGRVADVLEVASTAQGDVLANLQRVVNEGEASLSPLVSAGMEELGRVTDDMANSLRPPAK